MTHQNQMRAEEMKKMPPPMEESTATWAATSSQPSGPHIVITSNEQQWETVTYRELPGWMRDNEYIHKHYRPQLNTVRQCFRSVFRIHTETVNIWTHLLGLGMIASIMIYTYIHLDASHKDKLVFSAFFVTAFICFFNSTIFHIICCYSPTVSRLFNRMDYVSIIVLTVGSFFSWIYYTFSCYFLYKTIYISCVCGLGLLLIIMFSFKRFTKPKYRHFRAAAFVGLGVSGIVPILHMLYVTGFNHAINTLSLSWLALLAMSYILGAIIYAQRIPERWCPGYFDVIGHSHQFLHLSTVAAVIFHSIGLWRLANYQLHLGSCLPGSS